MARNTSVRRGKITGTLTAPRHFTENWRGEFDGINLPIDTKPVAGRWKGGFVELVVGYEPDWDRMPMTLPEKDHALLDWAHGRVPAWRFERIATGQKAVVATDWPVYDLDPEIVAIRQQLRTLAEEDQAAREKKLIDPKETGELSEKAKSSLEAIYAHYGWPKLSVFGTRASDDFWLLVQHQPLSLQEHMLSAMKTAVDAGEASKGNYAHLFDRVQVGEGKPQHWGTQSRCENGSAVLYPLDDVTHLEELRKEVDLDNLVDSLKGTDKICTRERH